MGLRVAVACVRLVDHDADRNALGSGRDEGISYGLAAETIGGDQHFIFGGSDGPNDRGGGAAVRAGVQFDRCPAGRRRK